MRFLDIAISSFRNTGRTPLAIRIDDLGALLPGLEIETEQDLPGIGSYAGILHRWREKWDVPGLEGEVHWVWLGSVYSEGAGPPK